jgi:hypothetical protein
MYFYEANGQVDQIKEHINAITNASQPQLLMKGNSQSIKGCPMSTNQKLLPIA